MPKNFCPQKFLIYNANNNVLYIQQSMNENFYISQVLFAVLRLENAFRTQVNVFLILVILVIKL